MNEEQRLTVFKRWLPGIGLVILTVALLFYFKNYEKEINTLVEKGKQNFISYLEDLKPIIFRTEYLTEDVFNFAFYQELPLDRQNDKVLQLEESSDKTNSYKIAPASETSKPYSYGGFLESIEATDKDNQRIDSILNSYIDDLSAAVLYNEKNTLAVNSNLHLLNKAILADIYSYLHSTENYQLAGLIPRNFRESNIRDIQKMLPPKLPDHQNEFIVLAPDTVFKQNLSFNYGTPEFNKKKFKQNFDEEAFERSMDSLKNKLKKLKIDIAIQNDELKAEKESLKTELKTLSQGRERIVRDYSARNYAPDVDSIIVKVNKVTDKLKSMSFAFLADTTNKKFNFNIKKDGAKVFEMNFDMSGFDSTMKKFSQEMVKENLEGLKELKKLKGMEELPDSVKQKFIDSVMEKQNFNFNFE